MNYKTWYSLAQTAAADAELKTLATDIKDNFYAFLCRELTPAGQFFYFFGAPDHTFLLDKYDLTVGKTSESSYVISDEAVFNIVGKERKEDSIIVAEAAEAVQVTAPASSASGYPLLKKLLLDWLKGKEIFPVEEAETAENYVYDFESYRFVLPEFFRGKVEVMTRGEDLSILYNGRYVVGISEFAPDEEYQSGDPMQGNRGVGVASNKNYVARSYNSCLPMASASSGDVSLFADTYPGLTVEELSNLIWLQTGKTYDMATIGTLDHIAAYGESFWCVELVESNITLK